MNLDEIVCFGPSRRKHCKKGMERMTTVFTNGLCSIYMLCMCEYNLVKKAEEAEECHTMSPDRMYYIVLIRKKREERCRSQEFFGYSL